MPSDDERKPGKAGQDSATGAAPEREPREGREGREGKEARDTRLPLTELLKRGLSAGQAVSESLFPRELASSVASQLVDARHGLVNAIASEVGRFLRQADIASEMRKVLTGLKVEATIQLRFSEDEHGKVRPEVKVEKSQTEQKNRPPQGSEP
jgi:hypothetical protein